jgi:hypothetical protein
MGEVKKFMITASACIRCKSEKVVPRVRVKAGGPNGPELVDITAVIYENPDAMVFTYPHRGSLYARICGECGHAEMFVENPQEFYEVYKNNPQP